MTNEKRYELVCEMLRKYDEISNSVMGAAEQVIKKPHEWMKCDTYFTFYADAAALLIEAKEGMDKKVTPGARLTALKRVWKNASPYAEKLNGIFKSGERWAVCDGYRWIRVNSKPESIPECICDLDLDKTIPADAKQSEVVELPSAVEIKSFIASHKVGRGKPEPMEALPGWWCDPQFLLDLIQALPDGKAYRPGKPFAPLYGEAEDGDAILLPVRHTT